MRAPPDIRALLVETGNHGEENIDLAETALILASAVRPGVSRAPYLRHLQVLVDEVADYAGGTRAELGRQVEALTQVIIKRYGYGATNDFDDLDAANLMRVIDTRSGLPVVLGILFIHVSGSLGWQVSGIAFPGRFLVRLEYNGTRTIIDPFANGRALTAQDLREMLKALSGNHAELAPKYYREMSARAILLRLQENIKTRLLREGRLEDALDVIETMLLFAPDTSYLWRECGLIQARLYRIREAVISLEEHLKRSTGVDACYSTSVLLQRLRAQLN